MLSMSRPLVRCLCFVRALPCRKESPMVDLFCRNLPGKHDGVHGIVKAQIEQLNLAQALQHVTWLTLRAARLQRLVSSKAKVC